MAIPSIASKDLRRLFTFGSGVGIEVGATDLEVVVARVRPSSIQVLGRLTIANFAERPAAEWGAEYAHFLKSAGVSHLSATVLLPRREVIVRQVALVGVASRDTEGAIRFQLDTLHPYGDDEICWGWSPLGYGSVMVGIARRSAVDRYIQLFTEAGIAVSSFTFSAAAVHAAIRVNGGARAHPDGFVAVNRVGGRAVEIYGESPAKPVFSAEFETAPERAAVLALSELRLPPDTAPQKLEELLPKPAVNPVENDLSRNALPYATALAGACPRLAPAANVLPAEHRRFNSRAAFVPAAVLAALVLLMAGAMMAYSSYSQRQYLRQIGVQIQKLDPLARRAAALDRQIAETRVRAELLDRFRYQTRNDLDALKELTRLIEPPAWTNSIDLQNNVVRITGEAPQAAPLLKILDSSPYFENSAFEMTNRSPSGSGEIFQIRSNRKRRP